MERERGHRRASAPRRRCGSVVSDVDVSAVCVPEILLQLVTPPGDKSVGFLTVSPHPLSDGIVAKWVKKLLFRRPWALLEHLPKHPVQNIV